MTAGLAILTYHALDDDGGVLSTRPGWFARTIDALVGAGWRCVDLGRWVADGRPAPDRAFAVAFDDGLASIRAGLDHLGDRGLPATVFAVAGRLGGDNAWPGQPRSIPRLPLLSAAEVRSIRRDGFAVGSHTVGHPRLDRLDPAGVESELVAGRSRLEDLVGGPCPLLAYPYGASSRAVRSRARAHHAAAFGTRCAAASAADPIDDLPRLDSYDLRTPARLDALISGRLVAALGPRWAARRLRRRVGSLVGGGA